MLSKLYIQNFALISQLEIDFSNGFSVITGETGSGKSIILGALGLILGERFDKQSLRVPNQKCIIEGSFKISKEDFISSFSKHDLDFERDTIIRREISNGGKSRAFINDTPVSLSVLKEVASQFIDIHSQHQTLLLHDNDFVFDILDSQVKSKNKTIYAKKFKEYTNLLQQLEKLKIEERQNSNELDYIQFQLSEFDDIDLTEIIENDIEAEFNLLSNAEEIKSSLLAAIDFLSNDNSGILNSLQWLKQTLGNHENLNDNYKSYYQRATSAQIELQDLLNDLSIAEGSMEIDEQRLSIIESKLSKTNALFKKHQVNDGKDLLQKKLTLESKLGSIDIIGDKINTINKSIEKYKKELNSLAMTLRAERKLIIPNLESEAQRLLSQMKMKNASIVFNINETDSFNQHGLDEINLLAKTNLGSELQPLKKIASGGECSRIMLAIKSLQSKTKSLPTIIFDEIDTGVSGEVATKMGNIMKSLGSKMQVFSITHLPQIASQGKQHYKVFKKEENQTTQTFITELNLNERSEEIAMMLSGSKITKEAMANANKLLKEV